MKQEPNHVKKGTANDAQASKQEAPKGLLSHELARYPSQAAAIAAWFAKGGKTATVKANAKPKNSFKILVDEVDAYAMRRRTSSSSTSSSSSSEGMRRAVGVIENHPWFFGYQNKVEADLGTNSPEMLAEQFVNHPLYEPFDFDDELLAVECTPK